MGRLDPAVEVVGLEERVVGNDFCALNRKMVTVSRENFHRSLVVGNLVRALSYLELVGTTLCRLFHGSTSVNFPFYRYQDGIVDPREKVDRIRLNYRSVGKDRALAGIDGSDVDGVVILLFTNFTKVIPPVSGVWLVGPVVVKSIVGHNVGFETSELVSCDCKRAGSRVDSFIIAFDWGVFKVAGPVVGWVCFSVKIENEVLSFG